MTSIGESAFQGCTGLTSVTIPNNVTLIRDSAFYGCKGLTSITIPDDVTSISGYTFYGCSSLSTLSIGEGVTSIGSYAFCNNVKLKEIYNYAAIPQNCGEGNFNLDKGTCKLYVLPESVEQYENHQDWYEFNINAMDEEMLGVESIQDSKFNVQNDNAVYDLSGRKVNVNESVNNSKLKKGIYIKGGKKILVK